MSSCDRLWPSSESERTRKVVPDSGVKYPPPTTEPPTPPPSPPPLKDSDSSEVGEQIIEGLTDFADQLKEINDKLEDFQLTTQEKSILAGRLLENRSSKRLGGILPDSKRIDELVNRLHKLLDELDKEGEIVITIKLPGAKMKGD